MFSKKTRILVVDDVEMMRGLVSRMLNELDFQDIDVAEDGQQAWEKIEVAHGEGESYGLVISDVMMPRMTGIELLKKVRESKDLKEIPFIVLSADVETNHVMDAIKSGVNQYILKPFNSNTLAEKLKATHDALNKAGD